MPRPGIYQVGQGKPRQSVGPAFILLKAISQVYSCPRVCRLALACADARTATSTVTRRVRSAGVDDNRQRGGEQQTSHKNFPVSVPAHECITPHTIADAAITIPL